MQEPVGFVHRCPLFDFLGGCRMKKLLHKIEAKHDCYIISRFSFVTEISKNFQQMIGYSKEELLYRDISEVLINLLKLSENAVEEILAKNKRDCYIFTKSLEAREVTISLFQNHNTRENIFIVVEKPNSQIEDKLPLVKKIIYDNHLAVAIYGATDLILLKANRSYLDLMDSSFDKSGNHMGSKIKDIIPWWEGSNAEIAFNKIIEKDN